MAGRFVLRYQGDGAKPEDDVAQIRALTSAVVVDASSRMLVVESDEEQLRGVIDALPDWVMAPEQTYAVPDTRKRVERPPD